MLKLTLYKQCILNETYQNVFSLGNIEVSGNTKTVLEHYLDTLTSKVVQVENVYQENYGTFIFDFELTGNNIYDYNYLKIESYTDDETPVLKIKRYAFVERIRIKNEVVYLTYREDLWSSYADKISGITESYMNRSRVLNYGNNYSVLPYNLPVDYQGNKNELDIVNDLGSVITTPTKLKLVCELQTYNLTTSGDINNREVVYCEIRYWYDAYTQTEPSDITYQNVEDILSQIQLQSSGKNFWVSGLQSDNLYYEVGNIYAIPNDFDISNVFDDGTGTNIYGYIKASDIGMQYTQINFYYGNVLTSFENVKTGTISLNQKNISFGTLTNQQAIINNGNNINYKVKCYCSDFNFGLFLSFSNKLINITEDFNIEIPFNSISGDTNAQRKIARELEETNLKSEKTIATSSFVQSEIENTTQMIGGISDVALYEKSISKRGQSNAISGMLDIANSASSMVTDAINYGATINKINAQIDANNAPVYSSSSGSFSKSIGLLNSIYSICIFKINSDNDNYVKKSINNLGYISYEYINDISKLKIDNPTYFKGLTVPINYNVIQFKVVNTYGSFTGEIAKALNTILESGVKIWFDYQMLEDNYV